MGLTRILLVGLGGFLGANCRYWLGLLLVRWSSQSIAGTLFVNFTGSLLLAVFIVWAGRNVDLPQGVGLFLATGFLGSYTTFSTFANEGIALARDGHWGGAAMYIVGTNAACLLGVLIGIRLSQPN